MRGNIQRAASGEALHVIDGRILLNDANHFVQLFPHGREGNVLVSHNHAADTAGILLREEAFRHDDVEIDAYCNRDERDDQGQLRVTKNALSVRA